MDNFIKSKINRIIELNLKIYDYYQSLITLEETKDKIKTTLKNNLIKNTSNISVFALEWLREKYDLKIYDAELKIKYDHYMNEQKSSKTTES